MHATMHLLARIWSIGGIISENCFQWKLPDCSPKNIIHRRSTIVLLSSRMHHSEFVHSPSSWVSHSPCSLIAAISDNSNSRFHFLRLENLVHSSRYRIDNYLIDEFSFYNHLSTCFAISLIWSIDFKITNELFLLLKLRKILQCWK